MVLQLACELQPIFPRHDDVQDREIVWHASLLGVSDTVQGRVGILGKVVNHPPAGDEMMENQPV